MLRSRNRTIQLLAISSALSLLHFFATIVLNAVGSSIVRRILAPWGVVDGVIAATVAIRIVTLQLRSQRAHKRARSAAVHPTPPVHLRSRQHARNHQRARSAATAAAANAAKITPI
eukprot:TRINITY_DN51601_c0_g1_i1.p1 TRINITY_DN51601_c0_g1~~TRINITY_DN51601_c0_g1_i1.p1  ORF type:complete len:116 (-),score=28.57 TRINITY_DN51601_c0_g1_i1:58-405(-)